MAGINFGVRAGLAAKVDFAQRAKNRQFRDQEARQIALDQKNMEIKQDEIERSKSRFNMEMAEKLGLGSPGKLEGANAQIVGDYMKSEQQKLANMLQEVRAKGGQTADYMKLMAHKESVMMNPIIANAKAEQEQFDMMKKYMSSKAWSVVEHTPQGQALLQKYNQRMAGEGDAGFAFRNVSSTYDISSELRKENINQSDYTLDENGVAVFFSTDADFDAATDRIINSGSNTGLQLQSTFMESEELQKQYAQKGGYRQYVRDMVESNSKNMIKAPSGKAKAKAGAGGTGATQGNVSMYQDKHGLAKGVRKEDKDFVEYKAENMKAKNAMGEEGFKSDLAVSDIDPSAGYYSRVNVKGKNINLLWGDTKDVFLPGTLNRNTDAYAGQPNIENQVSNGTYSGSQHRDKIGIGMDVKLDIVNNMTHRSMAKKLFNGLKAGETANASVKALSEVIDLGRMDVGFWEDLFSFDKSRGNEFDDFLIGSGLQDVIERDPETGGLIFHMYANSEYSKLRQTNFDKKVAGAGDKDLDKTPFREKKISDADALRLYRESQKNK